MDIREFHWLMNIIQTIDVGLMVLDRDYKIQIWNGFMESHSGQLSVDIKDRNLFEQFPEIDEQWFKRKAELVFKLNIRGFTTWEQKPCLIRFCNYRPITGSSDFMYQNMTLLPLLSFTGKVEHIAVMLYDATDQAIDSKNQQE
ncbi:PAS domain-containing protein [Dongshaea marina]|uniref:PAS domain-containing protein n=1 Tax=Dongshaea marina TaxID=2047966 RepID=UPI000D3E3AE0|nr:PAS domain-containing protein [Dongshaea marina]